jgi:hypothetical protein
MIILTFHLGYQYLWNYFEPYITYFLNSDSENLVFITFQHYSPLIYTLSKVERIKTFHSIRGCDIGGQLMMFNEILKLPKQPDFVIVLHTKGNKEWREELVKPLFINIDKIKKIFEKYPFIGMIGSKRCLFNCCNINEPLQSLICSRIGIRRTWKEKFIAGTMFWVRWNIFHEEFKNKNLLKFYEELEEHYSLNIYPTKTHSWERIFGIIIYSKGKYILGISVGENLDELLNNEEKVKNMVGFEENVVIEKR